MAPLFRPVEVGLSVEERWGLLLLLLLLLPEVGFWVDTAAAMSVPMPAPPLPFNRT